MRYEEMMQEEKKFIKDLGKKETFEFTHQKFSKP